MKEDRAKERVCVVLPAYREGARVGDVIRRVLRHGVQVVVVDDGSPDATAAEAEKAGAAVIRHEQNRGKGAALNTGFDYAKKQGFDVVITMDADGQHDPDDVPRFVEAYVRTGIPVLIGNRMANRGRMPLIRVWTNLFMSWLLSREMNRYVPDTQCGFRLYRCDVIPLAVTQSGRFAAESEILLLLAERGLRMDSVSLKAIYGNEHSKINPLKDTFRFFSMLRAYRRRRTARLRGRGVGGR